jgi:hypothetical protein
MSEEEIKVVRTASCLSLSGRSTISYEFGSLGDSQYIRLSGNSAGGIFCKGWLAMADIQPLLSGNPSSKTLQAVYAGKSTNSPGFLLAALVHENLCTTGKDSTETAPSKKAPTETETPPKKKSARKTKD